MEGVSAIFLCLLYVIFILVCWRDFQKNNPSKQYRNQLKDLTTEESTEYRKAA